jgi:HD-GYP domain-containing protein (c-di-GMP phosphodiesterase class II)
VGGDACAGTGRNAHALGRRVERALAAMGDFADLISSYFIGHSAAVAQLAGAAAARLDLAPRDVVAVRRAALVHDLGRVAVGASVWNKPTALTADEWERVRLHLSHREGAFAISSVDQAGLDRRRPGMPDHVFRRS